jgi:hypothetical protein
MDTVVLRTFDNHILAHITSDKLRNEGVENYLFDEASVTVIPLLSAAIGGIKLVVDKRDERRALQLLHEFDEAYRKSAVCPKCDASEIILVPKQSAESMVTAIFTWLFSRHAVAGQEVYHCNNCGYESDTLPEPPEGYVSPDLL